LEKKENLRRSTTEVEGEPTNLFDSITTRIHISILRTTGRFNDAIQRVDHHDSKDHQVERRRKRVSSFIVLQDDLGHTVEILL